MNKEDLVDSVFLLPPSLLRMRSFGFVFLQLSLSNETRPPLVCCLCGSWSTTMHVASCGPALLCCQLAWHPPAHMETGHPHPDSHRMLFGSVDSIANANDIILQSLPAGNTVRLILFMFTLLLRQPNSSYPHLPAKTCMLKPVAEPEALRSPLCKNILL
jgi:hypothetical protein